jgi:CHAT domain-containing protein
LDELELERRIDRLHAELTSRAAAGLTDESFALAAQLLDLVREYRGCGLQEYADDLHRAADLYREKGQYGFAEQLYGRAIDLYKVVYRRPSRAEHARQLHQAACAAALNRKKDDADIADPLMLQKVERVLRLASGEDFSYFAVSQFHLACVYAATDRIEDALAVMREAVDSDDFMIRQVCAVASEEERRAFVRRVQKNGYLFLSLVLRHFGGEPAAVGEALGLVFRRKALSADVLAAQRAFVGAGQGTAAATLLAREAHELRRLIARKTLAGPEDGESLPQHLDQLDTWQAGLRRTEIMLARATALGGARLDDLYATPSPEQVRQALPADAALIEYVRLPLFDFRAVPASGQPSWGEPRYLAFVLPPGTTRPCLFDLGAAHALEADLGRFLERAHSAAQTRDLCRVQTHPSPVSDLGSVLREALLDLLLPALGGCRRLVIAPDGALCRLPLEALPAAEQGFLLDSWRISYLASGRDAVRRQTHRGRGPGASVVLAAPNFNLGREGVAAQPKTTPAGRFELTRALANCRFLPLHGTLVEGKRVAGLLGVQPWLGDDTLKSRLWSVSAPCVLHLATHGFFLDTKADEPQPEYVFLNQKTETARRRFEVPSTSNPMLRSGLAMAGVNAWLDGGAPPEPAGDGLLTAEEVVTLNLEGTELVVLSACFSGLGTFQAGDGVLGLRRAFVVAGAKTLVMSLWGVPDLATAFLMDRFYDNLLTRGLDRDLALSAAQRATRDATVAQLRADWLSPGAVEQFAAGDAAARRGLEQLARQPDGHRPFASPFFWGAFICQGDQGPLRPPTAPMDV